MKKITKTMARALVDCNKDETAYFGKNNIDLLGENISTFRSLYDLLLNRCSFGEAETLCIIGALVLSGAVIEDDMFK